MADYAKEKAELNSGLYFRPVDGENRFRILTEPIKVWKQFDPVTKTAKVFLTEEATKGTDAKLRHALYVINRSTQKLQIAEFGKSIMNQLFDLALSKEYGFDSLPPYDMILNKKGEGMTTEYALMPARANTELTAHEAMMTQAAKPLIDVLKEDAEDVEAYNRQADGQPF